MRNKFKRLYYKHCFDLIIYFFEKKKEYRELKSIVEKYKCPCPTCKYQISSKNHFSLIQII